MLTAWQNDPETAWLYEVSNVALQQGLQHLQNACVNFWGKRARYPAFKSKDKSRASATFTTSGFRYRDGRLTLAKTDAPLNIRWSRPLPVGAEPSTVTVSRDAAGRWHISILAECAVETLPPAAATVGVDAGITSLVTLSTGGEGHQPKARAPRPGPADEGAAGTVPQSQGVREPAEGPPQGREGAYPDHRPAPRPPAQAFSPARPREPSGRDRGPIRPQHGPQPLSGPRDLGRELGELRRQLEYKADWYGRTVIAVDRFYPSSKTCSACGVITANMPLNIREWACASCGTRHDRDVNAAKVLQAAGLAVLACGDGVRPPRT